PNGIDVFLYPLTIIKAGYVASNREWLSPFDNALSGYYMQKYFIVYSLILFTVLLINLKKICLKDILLPCLFFALAVKSQRNIALFAIISLPIFIKNISFSADKIIHNHKINAKIVKLFTIILFLFLIIFFYKYGVPIADKGRGFAKCGLGINKAVVPVDALDFIIKENISGNFFNSYQFGGYILYRGCPKIKVFIDGRADVYGKQLYHSFRKSLVIAEEFKKNMSKYNFNSVLLAYGPDNKALHDFLHQSKDWILVYFDSICLLYIKNTDKNLSVIKQYGYSFVNPIDSRQTNDEKIPALIDEYNKAITINPNVDYAYIRLAKLYRKKGDYINSLKISKKALKKFPNHYSILNQMGISYKYLDNYISAEKCFQKAVKANPYLLDAYGNLAVLYYEKNDFKKTREFLKKTLRINPQDKIAKKILKEIGIN
ncbi:tetratricopeptide repeat protein, partial [bacterium]|nr:tetratricopeptide repeat protein [bacterium]